MLVQCKECGKQISDTAASCPSCGYANQKAVQTIEQTGKGYKASILIFMLGFALGAFLIIGGAEETGATIALISIVGYALARIGAWWSHG